MKLQSMPSQRLKGFQWALLCLVVMSSCSEAVIQCPTFYNGTSRVPDILTNSSQIGETVRSIESALYIYPGSASLSCNGTVTGVEYCYQADSLPHGTIFTLLALSRMTTSDGEMFTVERAIRVPAPTGACSVGQICCDSYTFATDEQFALPQDDFNFGVLTPPGGRQVVGFHSKHFVSGYLITTPPNVALNSVINPSSQSLMTLRVLRLIADVAVTPSDVCDGVSSVPDIPASVIDPGSTFYDPTVHNVLYIYPSASPSGCSGTATGVEYCYEKGNSSSSGRIFTALVMSRVRSGSDDVFTVTREIPIPTPTSTLAGQCSGTVCCDSYTFTINQRFEIPQDFTFGILTPSNGHQVKAFQASAQLQYSLLSYLMIAPTNFGLNSVLTLSTHSRGTFTFRVMRFIVDSDPPLPPTIPTTTIAPPSTIRGPIEETAPPIPTTDPPMTTTAETSSTNSEATTDSTTTEIADFTFTIGTLDPPAQVAEDTNVAPIVVGVLVGLAIGVALGILGVSLLVMFIRKNRTKKNAPDSMVDSGWNTTVNGQGQFHSTVYSPMGQINPQ